jgi:tetratricopeptide (TPR) repeat protein
VNGAARDAVEALLAQAEAARTEGRYREAQRAAEAASEAADGLAAVDLEVRAGLKLADALRMQGDTAAALAKLTWILGVAQDAANVSALDDEAARWSVAMAWMNWVDCARFLPEIEVASLFRVLNEGEAWLRSVGRSHWRAGLLLQRASLLQAQRRFDEAVGFAEEALALTRRRLDAPGYTLASHRVQLADLYYWASRYDDASRHYQDVLDDPAAVDWDHMAAHEGLVRCALARDDGALALHHAKAAVALAEGLGDAAMATALQELVAACRAAGRRDEARAAAERFVDIARRLDGTLGLHFAVRARLDVALDDGDAALAEALLPELEHLALLLDRQTGTAAAATELAVRRGRYEGLVSRGGASRIQTDGS